jgi:3-dehydroquinate dehydratase type I
MICVPLVRKTKEETLRDAKIAKEAGADIVELRIDYLEEPEEAPKIITAIGLPAIATLRPEWEGGKYNGREGERAEILLKCAKVGAEYIDVELRAGIRTKVRSEAKGTKIIFSWHDFDKTPPLEDWLRIGKRMKEEGADIGKIVCFAKNKKDALVPLKFLDTNKLDIPFIAFCMGEAGADSRVKCIKHGSFLTFAALPGRKSAEGQISIGEIKEKLKSE